MKPCQDVSAAGKRAGLVRYGDSNRSGLWAEMARAIDILRPALVVAENVRGLLSAKADAHPDVFDCLACMAHTNDEPMRALGAVLGDLAALGYDAAWHGVRASDVGAPHQRFRVFVIAWPATDTGGPGLEGAGSVADAQELTQYVGHRGDSGEGTRGVTLLPTPVVTDAKGARNATANRSPGKVVHSGTTLTDALCPPLLPTPGVADAMGGHATRSGARSNELLLPGLVKTFLPTPSAINPNDGEAFDTWEARRLRTKERVGNGNGFGMPLSIAVQTDWGVYASAINRWEELTRPAPAPTETGPRGGQRLSPAFVEWMMGLPPGHVTDPAIGLTRNEQLKALGNGVVPQQAEHAIRHLLAAVAA